jgi:CRP/FNR family transcriptional regulator
MHDIVPMLDTIGNACADCPIRHRAVCSLCEPGELAVLERIKSYRTYAPGEPIFWAGDDTHFVGTVVEGHATISKTLEDGRRQTLGLLLPSDFIGRPDRAAISFDVTAHSAVTLCCFRRKDFAQIVQRTPRIGRRLLEMSLDELDAAREWMLLLGRKTAREKVASLVSIFGRRAAGLGRNRSGGGWVLQLPMTREQMADYLGITLETVSRQISALKRDGIIELPEARTLVVPDPARLLAESGDA